jgi:DNA-binding MarR family transcriptional regulator
MMANDFALPTLRTFLSEVKLLAKLLQHANMAGSEDDPLSSAELNILQILSSYGPQTVPQLARARGTSRQNIQLQVNRLCRTHKVELVPNSAHKRSALVKVSEHGQKAATAAGDQECRLAERVFSSITEQDLAGATDLLRKMTVWLGQPRTSLEPTAALDGRKEADAGLRNQRTPAEQPRVAEPQGDSDENGLPVNLL